MSNLNARLAALEAKEEAALPVEGVPDAAAELCWGIEGDPANELLAENASREQRMYPGPMLAAKRYLQGRGWPIWYVEEDGTYAGRATNWLRIGDRVRPVAELRMIAEREARLARGDA